MLSQVSLWILLLHLGAALRLKTDCPKPCIPIEQCPELVDLIKTNIRVVQEATCSFEGRNPLVCCPGRTNEPLISTPEPPAPATPNPLLPKTCGEFSQGNRVHGGNKTRLGDYPWMAALGFKNSFTNKLEFLCGGSVISEQYILTAAHCFEEKKLDVVRLAEWDLSSETDCESSSSGFEFCNPEPAQNFEYEEVIRHPEYKKRGLVSDDIALIRLARPINFSRWIQPVCLPDRDLDVAAVLGKRRATITGWGFTENGTASNILLEVALPRVEMAACNRTYNARLVGKQLCFGGILGQDSCGGDSGGPLVMSEFSAPPYTQIGIVSFGPKRCGQKDVPGVYASVSSYRDWIDQNMRP